MAKKKQKVAAVQEQQQVVYVELLRDVFDGLQDLEHEINNIDGHVSRALVDIPVLRHDRHLNLLIAHIKSVHEVVRGKVVCAQGLLSELLPKEECDEDGLITA